MSRAHELTDAASGTDPPRRVLVTGAAGRIGSYFARQACDRYELVLSDRPEAKNLDELADCGQIRPALLEDLDSLKQLCRGVDAVLHLAADPSPAATWDSLRENNIAGTYNVFVAAREAGVRRVVYASSIHAVSGYPQGLQVRESDPPQPGDLYGVSKAFGEALARYMADQEGLSSICIRIGAFQTIETVRHKEGLHLLPIFVSRRDLFQLITRCLDAADIRFAVVHGVSNNAFNRLSLHETRQLLGYEPRDDTAVEHPELSKLHLNQRINPHNRQSGQPSGLREQLDSDDRTT